jgi:hypothetical protein
VEHPVEPLEGEVLHLSRRHGRPPPLERYSNDWNVTEDPREIIAGLVAFWAEGLPRTASVFRMIREAAALDPDVAELERRRSAQRLANYGHAAGILAARGGLREGLSVDDAAAVIHAVGHPDEFRFLVLDQAWPVERWAAWARSALEAALLR